MGMFRRDRLSLVLLTILGLCLISLLYMHLTPVVTAQTFCSGLPPTEPGVYSNWPQGATVRVNIDSTYTDENQRGAIRTGFVNWTAAGIGSAGNCSKVTFSSFSNNPVDPAILQGAVTP